MLLKNLLKYKTTTERIAPSCMQMVNSFTNGSVAIPITEEPIIIWPVEETGKNSVNPSMMARIKACKKLINFYFFKMA